MQLHQDLKFVASGRLQHCWNISRTTLWRLEQADLLQPYYLNAKKLYRLEDVNRLEAMIERGELRSVLRGATQEGTANI